MVHCQPRYYQVSSATPEWRIGAYLTFEPIHIASRARVRQTDILDAYIPVETPTKWLQGTFAAQTVWPVQQSRPRLTYLFLLGAYQGCCTLYIGR